jgi:hypothetical protein
MEAAQTVTAQRLGLVHRLRFLAACLIAIALMSTVGWMVAAPADPAEAVALTVGAESAWSGIIGALPALILLVAVATAIGTIVVGRDLPEAGVFAAGIGLAALALRGGSMNAMLAYHVGGPPGDAFMQQLIEQREGLMIRLALDSVLWAVVMLASWLTMEIIRRWLWPASENPTPKPSAKPQAKELATWNSWGACGLSAVVAMLVIWLIITRSPITGIVRGQVIAAVAIGSFAGSAAGRYFFGITDSRWYVAAPLVVALVGYLLGYLGAELDSPVYANYRELATTPLHNLARPLPIEYMAVGVPGALAGFWVGRRAEHAAEQGAL